MCVCVSSVVHRGGGQVIFTCHMLGEEAGFGSFGDWCLLPCYQVSAPKLASGMRKRGSKAKIKKMSSWRLESWSVFT